MGEVNLAKIFGYTLVGNSCPEPSLTQFANEVSGQQSVRTFVSEVVKLV